MSSVDATVFITSNETGEVRSMETTFDVEDGNGDYLWGEGGFGCDCNRNLFFERECLGLDDDEGRADGRDCGDEAFTVRILGNDGFVLYED